MNQDSNLKLFISRLQQIIDSFSEYTGKFVAWLVLGMVFLVSYDVAMRYFCRSGSIAIQELEWHLFAIIFLLGAAYTFKHDEHVRLDLFYKSRFMNDYRRAWLNLLGGMFMLIPFCLLIIISAWPFIAQSYIHLEGSPDPGGLSHRWLLKACIPLGFTFLLIQGVADILRNFSLILDRQK
jgi:TRAP-type mannitol/chloroaromatic compound transport system permease small subunit